MSEIDQRIVQMRFDNSQFEAAANTTISTLDKLKKGLNLEKSVNSLSQLNDVTKRMQLDTVASGVQTISDRFSTLGIIGVRMLENIADTAFQTGKKIVASLSIDRTMDGFREYELKMESVKTIMAGTGASLETVKNYLEELNVYADRTIYSFSDMTSSIGKFTNAGVGLEDAVNAIKGISNEAARSGANAQQASHAMYNFAQALSAGYVKLIDWKSIENAQMATVEFKQSLIDTAEALGTVVKVGDKWKSTTTDMNGHTSELFDATSMFNDSLSAQWMSTEVLVQTLNNYATDVRDMSKAEKEAYEQKLISIGYTEEQIKQIEELGSKANDAAKDVTTFSKMVDALKEAAGSGWAQTFEYIFGDFDEAKKMWTELNDYISGILSADAERRNRLLEGWHRLGGRLDLIQSFRNIAEGLQTIFAPIQEAFTNIFGEIDVVDQVAQLKMLTYHIRKFTEGLKLNEEQQESVRNVATLFFQVLDAGVKIFEAFVENAGKLVKAFAPLANSMLTFTGQIASGLSDIITNFDIIGGATKIFKAVVDPVTTVITSFGKAFGIVSGSLPSVASVIEGALNRIGGAIDTVAGLMETVTKNFSMEKVLALLGTTGVGVIVAKVIDLLDIFKKKITDYNPLDFTEKIAKTFESLREGLNSLTTSINVGIILQITGAVVALSLAIALLASIPAENLASAVGIVGVALGELTGTLIILTKKLIEFNNPLFFYVITKSMIKLAESVLIFAAAMKLLSSLNPQELATGLAGIGGILLELVAALALFKKVGPEVALSSSFLLATASAVLIFSGALKVLGTMDFAQIGVGLAGIGGALLEVAAFAKLTSGTGTNLIATGAALNLVATAMVIFSAALKNLSTLSLSEVGIGLLAVGGALAEFAIAGNLLPKDLLSKSAGIMGMATAMVILSSALSSFGSMSITEIGSALAVMGGSLIEFAIALNAMKTALPGAAALIVAATAINILVPALQALGELSVTQIITALASLAGVFVILGVAGTVLSPLTGTLIGLSGAIALLGIGIGGIGAGIALFASGLLTLAGAGVGAAAGITTALVAIAAAIPAICTTLAMGVIAFAKTIADGATAIIQSAMTLIMAFLGAITDNLSTIITMGLQMLLALLTGIRDNIVQITNVAVDIILLFVDTVRQCLPEIAAAGWDLIIALINAISATAEEKAPELLTSMTELGINIVKGVLKGITDSLGLIKQGIADLGTSAVNALKDVLGIESPSKVFAQLGGYTAEGYIQGITLGRPGVVEAAASMAGDAVAAASNGLGTPTTELFKSLGLEIPTAMSLGIQEGEAPLTDTVTGAIANMGDAAANTMASAMGDINEVAAEGQKSFFDQLFESEGNVTLTVNGITQTLVNGVTTTVDNVNEAWKDIESPVIHPELDTTKVEENAEDLATVFDEAKEEVTMMGESVAGIKADAQIANEALNSLSTNVDTTTQNIIKFTSEFQDKLKEVIKTIRQFVDASAEVLRQLNADVPRYVSTGEMLLNGLITGFLNKKQELNNTSSSMTQESVSIVESYWDSFYSTGRYLVQGIAWGIEDYTYYAVEAARAMALAVAEAAAAAMEIESPSKVFMRMGRYIPMGLAEGIRKNSSVAEMAGAGLSDAVINAARYASDQIQNLMDEEDILQPKIVPVLDLDSVRDSARGIKAIFAKEQTSIAVSSKESQSKNSLGTKKTGNGEGNVYNFTQNNYSPKALSRLDIYRQTKNQLNELKGLSSV